MFLGDSILHNTTLTGIRGKNTLLVSTIVILINNGHHITEDDTILIQMGREVVQGLGFSLNHGIVTAIKETASTAHLLNITGNERDTIRRTGILNIRPRQENITRNIIIMIGDKQIKLITVTVTVAADKGSNTGSRRSLVRLLRVPILREDLTVKRPDLDRIVATSKSGNLLLTKGLGLTGIGDKLTAGSIDDNTRLGSTTEDVDHALLQTDILTADLQVTRRMVVDEPYLFRLQLRISNQSLLNGCHDCNGRADA